MSRAAFDLAGPLPRGRTVIEASAGTGKTYSLTGLLVRYIAEAGVPLDQILVVTFTRAAANDLRERTRQVLRAAVDALAEGSHLHARLQSHPWMSVLVDPASTAADLAERHRRLVDAVSRFDELTITTIHGFCQQALVQLGVRSGTDPDAILVEDTSDLIAEVCRDLIVSALADGPAWLDTPSGASSHSPVRSPYQAERELIANVTAMMANPGAQLAPVASGRDEAQPATAASTAVAESARRWIEITRAALASIAVRRRARSEIGYDALISGLRDALADPVHGPAVTAQLAARSSVVLIDEFQDTDPVQWEVFSRAFADRTLVTVGDPKQAIYRFRGADVHAYLDAVALHDAVALVTNHRSDQRLLEGLEVLLCGATLGDARISFAPVLARAGAPVTALLAADGSACGSAVDLRVVPLHACLRAGQKKDLSMPLVRTLVLNDLVERTIALLDTTQIVVEGHARPVRPDDIAVLVPSHRDADNVAQAMRRARIPAVRTRTGSVFATPAATQWRLILAALAEPHRAPVVRAAALGWFLGADVVALSQFEEVQIELQEAVAAMADRLRNVGLSAFYDEQKARTSVTEQRSGVLANVLGREGGERSLTDLDHIAELLADALHGGACEPARVLRTLDEMIAAGTERNEATMRRIESDADAVQITTIHSAKGLEYPIVLLPFGFKQRANLGRPHSYRDHLDRRTLDLASSVGWDAGPMVADDEASRLNQEARRMRAGIDIEGDELRLMYVALTRAAHRVEIWWACTQRATGSALGRILLDRDGAGPVVNTRHEAWPREATRTGKRKIGFDPVPPPHHGLSEVDVMHQLGRLCAESDGAISLTVLPERIGPRVWSAGTTRASPALRIATSTDRRSVVDPSWTQWSFSRLNALVEAAADGPAGSPGERNADRAEPGGGGRDEPVNEPAHTDVMAPLDADGAAWSGGDDPRRDAPGQLQLALDPPRAAAALADLAGGTRFGTFVHTVLETLDADAPDLTAAVHDAVVAATSRAGAIEPIDTIVEGLVAAIRTPLGPLFAQRSLSEIPARDRLAELTFHLPLVAARATDTGRPRRGVVAGEIGDVLVSTLRRRDPLRPFAVRLRDELASVDVSGWMHGSIDVVVRVPVGGDWRYLVIDYKTNRLHADGADDPVAAYRPDLLIAAMEHSRYPLQALIYTVALHRYLRWRLGSRYEPHRHLGGVGYLFLRGMVGPATPTAGGVPHGVFSWRPPIEAVVAIDHLFATGRRP